MKRSTLFPHTFWYHEGKYVSFTVDLAHWALPLDITFGTFWGVRFLCFGVSHD